MASHRNEPELSSDEEFELIDNVYSSAEAVEAVTQAVDSLSLSVDKVTSQEEKGGYETDSTQEGPEDGEDDEVRVYEIHRIRVQRDASGGLGFSLMGPWVEAVSSVGIPLGLDDTSNTVSNVIEGGVAEKAGLRVGDIVTRVNDEDVYGMEHDAVLETLKEAGKVVKLTVERGVQEKSEEDKQDAALERDINKETLRIRMEGVRSSGMGFSITGGTDQLDIGGDPSIYVTKVFEGKVAAKAGLRRQDKITQVNETDVTSVTHETAVNALKEERDVVELTVERFLRKWQIHRFRVLRDGSGLLGFSISGPSVVAAPYEGVINPSDSSNVITKIIEGEAAEKAGLEVGFKVIRVNDIDIRRMEHDEVIQVLKEAGEVVELSVLRPWDTAEWNVDDVQEVPASLRPAIEVVEDDRHSDIVTEQQVEIDRLKQEMDEMRAEIKSLELNNLYVEQKHQTEIEELKTAHQAEIERKDAEFEAFKKSLYGLRTVSFRKVDGQFGAGHVGSSISSVVKGGPADLAGLMKGDHLISINGTKLDRLSEDQITKLSIDVADDVTLVVRFNPGRLAERMKSGAFGQWH